MSPNSQTSRGVPRCGVRSSMDNLGKVARARGSDQRALTICPHPPPVKQIADYSSAFRLHMQRHDTTCPERSRMDRALSSSLLFLSSRAQSRDLLAAFRRVSPPASRTILKRCLRDSAVARNVRAHPLATAFLSVARKGHILQAKSSLLSLLGVLSRGLASLTGCALLLRTP